MRRKFAAAAAALGALGLVVAMTLALTSGRTGHVRPSWSPPPPPPTQTIPAPCIHPGDPDCD